MDDKLNKILIIDQNIQDFIADNRELSDDEFEEKFYKKGYVDTAIKLLKKMNSKDLVEVVKRCRCLWNFVDLKKFIKKYPLNKTYLANNHEMYLEEYRNLQKTCYSLSDISTNFQELQDYMNILEVDDIERYLLTKMSNEQLYTLANSTGQWNEKLYYFSFFKKDN